MILVRKIFSYLNANCNYAVLRNYSGLPDKLESRDIDILIAKNDFDKNKKQIINVIQKENYKIATYFKSDRMITFVCSLINDDIFDIIQFDFFLQTSVYGLFIIDADKLLATRVFNGKIYHVTKEYEFLDKYLYLKLLNHPYPEKYHLLKTKMEQSDLLSRVLNEIVGCRSLQELEELSSASFKKRMLFANFKNRPWEQLSSFYSFFLSYLKNYLFYKGYGIGFTGADGSGKTTIIDAIADALRKTYPAIEIFHFRPSITPNLGEAAYKIKLKSEVDRNFEQPHRGGKTSKLNSLVRLLYYSLDYIFGYFLRVRPFLQKRSLVMFDRYYTDVIVDSRRSRIFLNHKFLYWFGKLFIPALDYNILLTADRDVILSRKQELDEKGIDEINERMNFLSKKKGYYLVMNNGKPEEAIQKILSIVFKGQHLKNMKRIMKA